MVNPTRRQVLAGLGALGLASFLAPITAQNKTTTQPALIERPQLKIVVPERYRNVKTLGDLTGEGIVCLIPPDRNNEEAMTKFRAEQEKYHITTRASFLNDGKKLDYFVLYVNYAGDKEEVTVPGAQIVGVTDLRGVSGISEAYFERHSPISHLLKYTTATGQMPMHVYLTETAADRLEKSALFRQIMIATISPTLPATVLPDNSEQAKLLRNEPCNTGIHEFFPKEPTQNYEFREPMFIPKE